MNEQRMIISGNALNYNDITRSCYYPGILVVNKMPIVLIFPVLRWYNIFTDYLFSSKF
jgi:hypothetical protein